MNRIVEMFIDEGGKFSSTRVVGVLAGFCLVAMGLAQAFSSLEVTTDEHLVGALEYVCIACLLWAQVGKFGKRDVTGGPQ